jgi:hypothetical protein
MDHIRELGEDNYHYTGVRVNEDPAHRGVRFPGMKVNLPQLPPRCPPFVYGEVKEVLAADGTLDGEFVDPNTAYTVIRELKVRPRFYEG